MVAGRGPACRPGRRFRSVSTYTHGHADAVLASHRWRTAANSAGYLLEHLEPEMRLLDVGSGPGTITADLAGLVTRVTAVEQTAEALALTEAGVRARGLDNVDLLVDDVHELSLPDDSFDVVHAHQVLQHLPDPVAALREMRRVCRPGGLIAVRDADHEAFTWYPADSRLDRWLDLVRTVHRAGGSEPDAGRRLLAWAHAAGLDEATATVTAWCFATPEDREYWGGMWERRILESALTGRILDAGLADRAELEGISAAWRQWVGQPDGWMMVPHGELLARV
jgi:SAM-dependent methyltransferase